jgi:hypothetical protein
VRRLFWLGLGLGAGAAAGIGATRWARRQADKVAPANLAREARGGLLDLSKLVAESIQEGKRAMAEAETQAREETKARGGPPVH